jgi:hypothetical protein
MSLGGFSTSHQLLEMSQDQKLPKALLHTRLESVSRTLGLHGTQTHHCWGHNSKPCELWMTLFCGNSVDGILGFV